MGPGDSPGKNLGEVIEAALREARCVIVVWSTNSVNSSWVRTEADEAQRRGVLVPALLEVDRFGHFVTILLETSVYFQLKGLADLA